MSMIVCVRVWIQLKTFQQSFEVYSRYYYFYWTFANLIFQAIEMEWTEMQTEICKLCAVIGSASIYGLMQTTFVHKICTPKDEENERQSEEIYEKKRRNCYCNRSITSQVEKVIEVLEYCTWQMASVFKKKLPMLRMHDGGGERIIFYSIPMKWMRFTRLLWKLTGVLAF